MEDMILNLYRRLRHKVQIPYFFYVLLLNTGIDLKNVFQWVVKMSIKLSSNFKFKEPLAGISSQDMTESSNKYISLICC